METSLPTPTTARVYVNLPEGNGNYYNGITKYNPTIMGLISEYQIMA
jgi:hypothetical protein